MIKEVEAKSIINRMSRPSSWFGVNYGINPYRGCQHHCIYCDSRSQCYRVENFDKDVIVKVNAPELLDKSLARMRKKYTIGFGAMSDPYIPLEKNYEITKKCLEVIDRHRMRVHLATKSNLVLRDVDILNRIAQRYVNVAMTVTTMNEKLAKFIEPNAPSPKERMQAVGILNALGVNAGIIIMPQLPFLMETKEHVENLVLAAKEADAKFIYPAFGMTLRDTQRAYYYDKLDEYDKSLRGKYEKRFKEYYSASCVNAKKMYAYFNSRCKELEIEVGMHSYEKKKAAFQMSIFDNEKQL